MKLSGSILSIGTNYLEYARELGRARIDYLHVDIFQHGDFDLSDLYQFDDTYLPLDVHLIYEDIGEEDINILNAVKAEFLNIQYENLKDKRLIPVLSEEFHGKFGLAVTMATPLEALEEYIGSISQVLVMCSTPGVSGAAFDDRNYGRVLEIHNKYPSLRIIVDGGINAETGKKMSQLGAEILVSGSYLCRDLHDLTRNAYCLKYMDESHINVKRNMIPFHELPVVEGRESFMDIVIKMNKYRLGLVFVTEGNKMLGVVSDGDIRRGFLKYNESIFRKKACDLMNRAPFYVSSDLYVEEVYDRLFVTHKGIDIIPIMESDWLVGSLDLHIGR